MSSHGSPALEDCSATLPKEPRRGGRPRVERLALLSPRDFFFSFLQRLRFNPSNYSHNAKSSDLRNLDPWKKKKIELITGPGIFSQQHESWRTVCVSATLRMEPQPLTFLVRAGSKAICMTLAPPQLAPPSLGPGWNFKVNHKKYTNGFS